MTNILVKCSLGCLAGDLLCRGWYDFGEANWGSVTLLTLNDIDVENPCYNDQENLGWFGFWGIGFWGSCW